ncbi:unnamed protein product [Sphenostylis stenocarpa]|uniref:MATH domain-containing protein n=1 Tax=Sphenostylis stenocarpa TaxID=92480 RepID=A0AA86SV76_9FABA|nr:unnamed protein product [Sphenostylis stenocarpa]
MEAGLRCSVDVDCRDVKPVRIYLFPKGNEVDDLLIYFDVSADLASFSDETCHIFKAKYEVCGFKLSLHFGELDDSSRGFIVNDTFIIEVHILVHKSEHVDQSASNIDNKVVECIDNKAMISTSFGELVDFMGIGKVEKDFVPLLEEVCSRYPSLIDSKQKKSQRFTEWAFTALGRVLHFLKTKMVRDMDNDAYNHLKILWEELETCKFDLTWLEPHVQSALGMKSCVERAVEVKRLEENMATLETETEILRTKFIEAEVNLELTRRDLVKAKEGFDVCDLDAELGYGGP